MKWIYFIGMIIISCLFGKYVFRFSNNTIVLVGLIGMLIAALLPKNQKTK